MSEQQLTEVTTPETNNLPEAQSTTEITPSAPPAAPKRSLYQNPTARLLNAAFWASLVLLIASFLYQGFFAYYSYRQQGAPLGISLSYSVVSLALPLLFCFFPFILRFFAEIVELLDKRYKS